jgi:hypothetical protein
MMRRLLVACLIFAAVPVAAATDDKAAESDLAGRYACEGKSPAGRPYHGLVDIVHLDDTYRVIWTLAGDSGELQQVMGVGILSNGIFAASYFGGGPGVAVYRIEGRKLVGEWTIGGADGATYPETLTRVSDEELKELEQQLESDQPHEQPQPPPARKVPAAFREAALR